MSRPRVNVQRWVGGGAALGLGLSVLLPCAAPAAGEKDELKGTAPVTTRLQVNNRKKTVKLVGYDQYKIVFEDSSAPADQQRKTVKKSLVEEAYFDLDILPSKLHEATVKRRWLDAANLLMSPLRPTLPYLDLNNNNAAEYALSLGDYLMRAAERVLRGDPSTETLALVRKRYETAYVILKYASAARWCSVGPIARLKSIKCLLALDKPKTARLYFAELDEPFPGDAAMGIYWLVKAELALLDDDYRSAMDAAVRSLAFENKDVDTFPDALLVSARCYEELQKWHRARDVYFEVAKIFPNTDWEGIAARRLRFILEQGVTEEEEETPIVSVFFGIREDINQLAKDHLDTLVERGTTDFGEDLDEDEVDE